MIEYIKRLFCKHGDMKIILENEWVRPSFFCGGVYDEKRQYVVCLKCGYKRKISNK